MLRGLSTFNVSGNRFFPFEELEIDAFAMLVFFSCSFVSNTRYFSFFRSSYKLTVQASDRGSPSLNARTTVEITITDVNDNKPIFQGLPYRRAIPEDFSTSELILKVRITYHIMIERS
jgi:hypothetical protein